MNTCRRQPLARTSPGWQHIAGAYWCQRIMRCSLLTICTRMPGDLPGSCAECVLAWQLLHGTLPQAMLSVCSVHLPSFLLVEPHKKLVHVLNVTAVVE